MIWAADDSRGKPFTISKGKMEYRLFGRTGVQVSVLGLGCGGFGGGGSAPELFGEGEDQPTAFSLMDRALDVGINYFDTAGSYRGGAAERSIHARRQRGQEQGQRRPPCPRL